MRTFKSKKINIQKQQQTTPLSPVHPLEEDEVIDVDSNLQGKEKEGTPLGYLAWAAIRTERDKENNQAGSSAPIAPTNHGTKRKRFIDPQEGATRASSIDEDGGVILTQVSKPVDKGKRRRISPSENGEDEEDEDDVFVQDERETDEERTQTSRRNLPRTSMHDSDPASASITCSPRQMVVFSHHSSGLSTVRGSAGPSATASDISQQGGLVSSGARHRSESEDPEPTSSMRRVSRKELEHMTEAERVNRLAKINRMVASRPERQVRKFWDQESTERLVEVIEEVGPRWAVIRDVNASCGFG
jgi:hypothetical protein